MSIITTIPSLISSTSQTEATPAPVTQIVTSTLSPASTSSGGPGVAVIGGIVGGLAGGLLILAFATILYYRRNKLPPPPPMVSNEMVNRRMYSFEPEETSGTQAAHLRYPDP